MHMIAYKDIRPKARALVSIPLAQDSAPELTSVELSDFHCPAPECSCTQNYLRISRFTRLRDSDPSDWRQRTAEVRLQVDHRRGEVLEVLGGPLGEWISDYLKQDRKWLAKLRKRVAEVAEWKRPDGWKSKDWSELEDASMISYHRIRPTEPTIVFEEDGREYFCADWYCWNPACDCTEMLLFMIDSDADLLGIVRIDRPGRRVLKVEKASIPEARLSALTDQPAGPIHGPRIRHPRPPPATARPALRQSRAK